MDGWVGPISVSTFDVSCLTLSLTIDTEFLLGQSKIHPQWGSRRVHWAQMEPENPVEVFWRGSEDWLEASLGGDKEHLCEDSVMRPWAHQERGGHQDRLPLQLLQAVLVWRDVWRQAEALDDWGQQYSLALYKHHWLICQPSNDSGAILIHFTFPRVSRTFMIF